MVDPARVRRRAGRRPPPAASPRRGARLAAEAFAHTATYDIAVASWIAQRLDDEPTATGWPAWVGADLERSDGAALRREPAPAGRALRRRRRPGRPRAGRAAARQGDVLQQLRRRRRRPCAPPTTSPTSRASRSSSTPTRAASPSAPTSPTRTARRTPATRCPRSAASSPRTARSPPGWPRRSRRSSPRWSSRRASSDEAVEILAAKKNIRLLRAARRRGRYGAEIRPIGGGLLRADRATARRRRRRRPGDDWTLRRRRRRRRRHAGRPRVRLARLPRGEVQRDPAADGGAAVGIGMGQVNRVDSCRLAVARAGAERARGSVAASDAFFPFADGLQVLIDAGVRAVVSPAARSATRSHRGRPRRPGSRCTSPAPATSSTDPAGRPSGVRSWPPWPARPWCRTRVPRSRPELVDDPLERAGAAPTGRAAQHRARRRRAWRGAEDAATSRHGARRRAESGSAVPATGSARV